MAQHINKVIITNKSALRAKYGSGANKVLDAVKKLVAADKTRGLKSQLVDVSSQAQMKRHKGKKVTTASSARQNKTAVDKIYRALAPDYVLLLGSVDVIPHQSMINPVSDDPDRTVDSDLPYACDRGYSRKIENFKGMTRVVGRLPDLTGATDPKYLVGLLETAAKYKSRPKKDFAKYLGISAKVWKSSTAQSIRNLFGASTELKTSPNDGPNWTATQLKRRMHFINCHGAPSDYNFYGQQGDNYPTAHDASRVDGKLSEGTVAAAECCYGAELYDPAVTGGQAGICNTYLASNAYAFFGSSTVAYGPAAGNGEADLITQYFLKHVMSGASAGRAALQARQDYLVKNPVLDPVDLKTLAQFNLMGDPAVHPVLREAPTHLVATTRAAKSMASAALRVAAGRAMRRASLMRNGTALAAATVSVQSDRKATPSKRISDILDRALREAKAALIGRESFVVGTAAAAPTASTMRMTAKAGPGRTSSPSIHLAIGKLGGEGPSPRLCVVLAREEDGAVVVERLFSR